MGKIKDAKDKATEQWKFMNERDPRLVDKEKEDWRKAKKDLGKK